MLDLAPDRVSQGLLRQLPVDPLIGALGPERTAEAVRTAIDPQVLQQPAEHRRADHLPLNPREDKTSTPAPQPIGPHQDHKGGAGDGNPVLPAGLHPRGRNDPGGRLQIALKLPIAADMKSATFVYVDPGRHTDKELQRWAAEHRPLWSRLRELGTQRADLKDSAGASGARIDGYTTDHALALGPQALA